MKKLFFLFIALMQFVFFSNAQQIADYYDFNLYGFFTIYPTLTDGTEVFAGQNNDDGEVTIPIGFSFKYGAHTYTSLTIGVNGAVSFVSGNIDYDNDLASADNDHSNMLAPLWDDLYIRSADNGKIVYKNTGQSPDKKLYIEWQNISWRNQGETVSFMLELDEQGQIYFLYGPLNSSESRSATVGINTSGGNDFVSFTPVANTMSYSTSVSNNSISTVDYSILKDNEIYGIEPKKPQNNDFDQAQNLNVTVADGSKTTGTLYGATNDNYFDNDDNPYLPEVWYSVIIPASGTVTVETSYAEGSNMDDTYLAAFTYSNKSTTMIAEDYNSGEGNFSKITLTGRTPGEVIYFEVQKNPSSDKSFDAFNIIAYNEPPANDACENFEPVTDFPYSVTQDATYATNNDGFLLYDNAGMNDGVWYAVLGEGANFTVNVTPDGTWDPEVAVFTGTCGNLNIVSYADNSGQGGSETLTFSTTSAGDVYYINIGQSSNTVNNPEGQFTLNIEKSCEPTVFTTSLPAETQACEGDDVVLEVEATGSGIINDSYSWFQENGSLGIHGTTLNITNVSQDDSYNYTCKVTNACGEVEETTTFLTVNEPAEITEQPQSVTVNEGDDVSLVVTANGSDIAYQWKKDGTAINGAENPAYSITDVQTSDAGSYTVTVSNMCNTITSNEAILTVNGGSSNIRSLENSGISIFPNPVSDILSISSENKIKNIKVYNLTGKVIVNKAVNNQTIKVNLSSFPSGIYFTKVILENSKSYSVKIVKE